MAIDYSGPRRAETPPTSSRRNHIAFAIVAALLIAAAIGLQSTVSRMKLTFRKLPVPPTAPMIAISPELGPWVQASVDRAVPPDFEHELGTREYVFREYVDTRRLSEKDVAVFRSSTLEQREKMLGRIYANDPKAKIRFAVTYYTGSVDTVPHVPERCFAADGFRPSSFQVVTWPILPRKDPAEQSTQVRLINFEDQIDGRSRRPRQVSYFFQVNGEYDQDPIFGVRKKLQNLLQQYAYFAKIELVTDLPDPAGAGAVMSDFLTNAMPEIERVLPDWTTAQSGSTQAGSTKVTSAAPMQPVSPN
jgi:hypothetical protein